MVADRKAIGLVYNFSGAGGSFVPSVVKPVDTVIANSSNQLSLPAPVQTALPATQQTASGSNKYLWIAAAVAAYLIFKK